MIWALYILPVVRGDLAYNIFETQTDNGVLPDDYSLMSFSFKATATACVRFVEFNFVLILLT